MMRTVSLTVLVVLAAGILPHGEASTGECDSMRHTCDSNFPLESDESDEGMMLLQVSAHVTGSANSQGASDLGNEEPTFSRTGPSPSPRPIHLEAYNQSHGSLIDINQKVYIEGQPVLGDGVGQDRLYKCVELAEHFVKNPMAPVVKVCGTGIRVTVFLLGRCGEGSVNSANLAHTWEIGVCDTGLPPSTCDSFSPGQDKRMGVAQSYRITQC